MMFECEGPGNDDVRASLFYFIDHSWQDAFVVLQVGVHDCNDVRRAGKHALDACRSQSSPANAVQATYA